MSLLLGLTAFCLIPVFVGLEETMAVVGKAGIGCIVAFFAASAGILFFPAFGWWILMRAEGIRISPLVAIKANFMGFPINFCTPSMYLGSEPLKMYYIARVANVPKRQVLATIIVSKIQELVGIVILLIISSGIFVWNSDVFQGRGERIIVALTVFFTLLLGFGILAFAGGFKPTVKAINLLARFGVAKRKLARLRTRANEMENMVRNAFVQRWRTFLLAQLISFLCAISIFVRPILFFWFLSPDTPVPFHHIAGIYLVTNFLAMLNIVPGNLGLFEGGVVYYFDQMGLGSWKGSAYTLITRIADFGLLVIGCWLLFHYGMLAMARRKEKKAA